MAPLEGVRVLDLTRLIPGPYASLLLADLGAEVIKVEDREAGDYLRNLPGFGAGMFAALNRGKRSIALDLKAPGGAAVLHRLCASADVLIEGFRPGVMARLGCAPLDLMALNERLVVCSISGFGQDGPWRARAGHDIGYLALSGALSLCGTGAVPALPGVQLADFFGGGQSAVVAILAALLERARTGRGRHLDISLAEGATGVVLPAHGKYAASGVREERGDNLLSGAVPCYRVYGCKSGAMALGALEPKFWARFCAAVGHVEWANRQFDRALSVEVDALFAQRTRDQWAALLAPADCCAEPVLELHELQSHPLHRARDLFVESDGLALLRTLPALVKSSELPRTKAPGQGEQTEKVLRDLCGASAAELLELRRAGVIQ